MREIDHDTFLKMARGMIAIKKTDGLLQKQIARKLHISRPQLSQYLRGDIDLSPEIKEKLIQILELEPAVAKLSGGLG